MSKKVIAIVVSDVHIHNWKSHNEGMRRTLDTLNILRFIAQEAERNYCHVLMPGDLFHGEVSSKLLTLVELNWPQYFNDYLLAISGNHDQDEKSSIGAPASSMVNYFSTLGKLTNLDIDHYSLSSEVDVWGIPYITYNKGFRDKVKQIGDVLNKDCKNILMIHTDLYGAVETDGREVDSVEGMPRNLGELFEDFDLVISGHIHKPQEIIKGHIIMAGAPNQQKRSDANGEFGYWVIYSDLSYKFIAIEFAPKFMFYNEGEVPGDDKNYWIMNRADGVAVADEDDLEFSAKSSSLSLAKAFLKATGEKRVSRKKALINILKEVEDDSI